MFYLYNIKIELEIFKINTFNDHQIFDNLLQALNLFNEVTYI
jgi:hypothetical protein